MARCRHQWSRLALAALAASLVVLLLLARDERLECARPEEEGCREVGRRRLTLPAVAKGGADRGYSAATVQRVITAGSHANHSADRPTDRFSSAARVQSPSRQLKYTTRRSPDAAVQVLESLATPSSGPADPNRAPARYKMVVGVLTAKREPPSVLGLARGLVAGLPPRGYKLLAWVSSSGAAQTHLSGALAELGFLTYVHRQNYSELTSARFRITYGDSRERVQWRSSHVLDYANLLERVLLFESEFVMVLEDDLQPAKWAIQRAYDFASQNFGPGGAWSQTDWAYLSMYSGRRQTEHVAMVTSLVTGACALVIKRSLVAVLVEELRADPFAAPVDILLYRWAHRHHRAIYERTPNLFQHISQHSSYTGEDQRERASERWRSVSYQYDEAGRALAALPPAGPGGLLGCYWDRPQDRDLNGLHSYRAWGAKFDRSSISLCRDFCREYFYFALQNGDECRCGNEFGRYGATPAGRCAVACVSGRGAASKEGCGGPSKEGCGAASKEGCGGPSKEGCGGPLANSVYRTKPFKARYVGCFRDVHVQVAISNTSIALASPTKCEEFCEVKGHLSFGLQNGIECSCLYGDVGRGLAGEEAACSVVCREDASQWCGGEHHYSVFRLQA